MSPVADGGVSELGLAEAFGGFEKRGNCPCAAVDDVEPLRFGREPGASHHRLAATRDNILAAQRPTGHDAALRDAREPGIISIFAGLREVLDGGERLRQSAFRGRSDDGIAGQAGGTRQKEANPGRAVIDEPAHGAIDADPLPAMRLHGPAKPAATALVPHRIAAKPAADRSRRIEKALAFSGHGSLADWGRSNGSNPVGRAMGA